MDNTAQIFLIEDNDGDVFLAQKAFEKMSVPYNITVANDGESALGMLQGKDGFKSVPRPQIILLDLNLPGWDGKKILQELKNDESLRRIPVIVMSSSRSSQDINKVYGDLASAYICKPSSISEYRDIVEGIEGFWFKHCLYAQA